jgi:hypothetical protein
MMFFAVFDEDSMPKKVGDRVVLIAPPQLISLFNQDEVSRLRPDHHHRLKARELDLENISEALVKDLKSGQRVTLSN